MVSADINRISSNALLITLLERVLKLICSEYISTKFNERSIALSRYLVVISSIIATPILNIINKAISRTSTYFFVVLALILLLFIKTSFQFYNCTSLFY